MRTRSRSWSDGSRLCRGAGGLTAAAMVLFLGLSALLPGKAAAQGEAPDRERLTVFRGGSAAEVLTLARHREFPALPWEGRFIFLRSLSSKLSSLIFHLHLHLIGGQKMRFPMG